MWNPKRILVPVDFSQESALALDWAIKMARDSADAHLFLCHVLPSLVVPTGPEVMGFDFATSYAMERRGAEERLRQLSDAIPEAIFSSYVVGEGSIAKEIERLCREKAMELVVMTTHGRRGLSRFLHGSTTEETARLAPCPVLVLHLNKRDAEGFSQLSPESRRVQ